MLIMTMIKLKLIMRTMTNEAHDANGEDDDDCDEESVKDAEDDDNCDEESVKDATPAFESTYVGGEGFAAHQPVSTHGTIFRQLSIFFPSKQAESRETFFII